MKNFARWSLSLTAFLVGVVALTARARSASSGGSAAGAGDSSSLLGIAAVNAPRQLSSIADARKSSHTDDDSVGAGTDDDDIKKDGSSEKRAESTASTGDDDSISSTKSFDSPKQTAASSNSTNHGNSTSSQTANSTEDGEGGVSEWSFHNNETAAEDAKYNVTAANATKFLPKEKEQKTSWTLTVIIIFTGLALILYALTAYKNCSRRRSKRDSYEEIHSLVV